MSMKDFFHRAQAPARCVGAHSVRGLVLDVWRLAFGLPGMRAVGGCISLLVLLSAGVAAPASSGNDVVFKALADELKRSMTLHLDELDRPYFVQYGVDDNITYSLTAAYGALVNADRNHSRVLHTQVRVGSPELDNSNFVGRGGGRVGGVTDLPTEDDYLALRQAIWRSTDKHFKDGVETLSQKRAYLKDRTVEDRPPDFSKAAPATAVRDRMTLSFKDAVWEDYTRRISAKFREFPHLESSEVSLLAGVENRYLLNSEGSQLRNGDTETVLRVSADALTDDGERLSDQLSYFAPTPEALPPMEEILADLVQMANRLAAARRAPILQDYTGPVLFEGQAATQLFRQLLARGITGQADAVGSQRRTSSGSDDLENRLGKRILPTSFQIYDDPRREKFRKYFLAGHYEYDDEGVPAQRVNIVVNGKLEGMVMGRAPTKQFALSNGHGRRGGGDSMRSAVGCLFIEATNGVSAAELKKQLRDAADGEGLKYGLRVEGIQSRSGGSGASGFFARGAARGGSRTVGDPISIYRVYVADGREELVRGCEFNSLEVQSLRRTLAAGNADTVTVQNSVIGATPSSSIIAPAILMGEVELSRIKQEAEKKPFLEAPLARKTVER